jgi:hypothetical protein
MAALRVEEKIPRWKAFLYCLCLIAVLLAALFYQAHWS